MNFWAISWKLLKMLYKILCCSASLFSFFFNIFWFMCNLASAGIPWLTLCLIIVCVISKFVRIRNPEEKRVSRLLGVCSPKEGSERALSVDDRIYWPIANRAAGYDAPENSRYALKKCVARGYRYVLLDASITACGQIVLLNRLTLERAKAGFSGAISRYTYEELRKLNITEQHPLASSAKYEPEIALTFPELLELLQDNQLVIFLFISDNGISMLEKLKSIISTHQDFPQRFILISRSPLAIYQLRKQFPQLICGLWTDKSISLPLLKASTLITSIYGAVYRNIIAPVVGISVVFISKDDFNLHIAELWRNVGVRPIVYNVNSPNEKRYFQKTMKTQYLTDSLRSEPHLLMKA